MSTTSTTIVESERRPSVHSQTSIRPLSLRSLSPLPNAAHSTAGKSSSKSRNGSQGSVRAGTSGLTPSPSGPSTDIQLQEFGPTKRHHDLLNTNSKSTVTATEPPPFEMTVRAERIYLAVLCVSLFMAGWNDATLGPLLPRLREVYKVNYTVVSVLFISQCIGFISGSGCNVYLTDKLGFGKLSVVAAATQIFAYTAMSPAPPFPVLCVANAINGFGIAIQDAQANTFIASIPRHESTNMGILHAIYGLGAFIAPFIATQFAQQQHWSFHYLCSASIAMINTAALLITFRGKRQEYFIPEAVADGEVSGERNTSAKYKSILSHRTVQLLSAYILVYVGVEVTIGGWIFSYLLNVRHGGPSAGYVSSGFFGGLTLGRVALLPINKKIGPQRVIYMYLVLAIILEFTIWFVPNLIQNAVAVSFVGLLLGPMYPVTMNVAAELLPRWLLGGSIGFIAATGQAGSAIFPFMTGTLANKYGVRVLEPLLVGLLAVQVVLWYMMIQNKPSRRE